MAENVEEIGTGKQQNPGGGRVFVVDPNPPNNEVVPSEDMFIYVKLSAYPKSRVTYNGSGNGPSLLGVEDEVNFISTKIKYNGEGKLEPKPQDTYATTDWTGIGGFKNSDTVSGGILEGFGIKSISIKYNASLVPQVDVTFTDVRGAGLFDVITNNDILSPFALFFKMPYPTFKLSVKGYFGQTVDYCLHMINWTSNFDGKTGNFDISANFLGFQQAFLNDMVLGNIIGVVNTTEGTNKLNKIFDASTNTEVKNATQGIRKLDDFFVQIANLNLDSERLKLNSDSFRLLKYLNGKVNLLEEIQSFVGSPISKYQNGQSNEDDTLKDFLKIKNDPNDIETDGITDNVLSSRKNYLSIRDFLLINIVNLSEYKSYVTTLNNSVKAYSEYINSVETDGVKDSLENLKNQSNDKTKNTNQESITKVLNFIKPKPEDKDFISLFNIGNDTDDWKEYLLSSQKNDITNNNFTLKNVFEEMYTEKSSLGIYLKENYPNDDSGVNSDFNIENFIRIVTTGKGLYSDTLSESTKVLVVDFREIRAVLAKQIDDLKVIIKSQKEIVQREINDELFSNFEKNNNFSPNIQNCFEIIANNTQAMVETIYDITKSSEESSPNSRNSILKSYDTDIPKSLLGGGKSVAWPTIYRTNDADGSKNEVYLGELNRVNRQIFPEYDFVERVYDNFVKRKERLEQITRSAISGLDSDNWFPINPIDYRENPFLVFRGYNDNDSVKESFIETTFERVGVLFNYSSFDNTTGYENLSNYGKFDALNAFDVLKTNNVKLLMLKKILDDLTTSDFLSNEYITNSSYYKENIEVITPGTNIVFKNNFDFGDVTVGEDYVTFNNDEIVKNSKQLIASVRDDSEYIELTEKKPPRYKSELKGNLFYQNSYESNNLTTNNLLNVWDIAVCKNLYKSNSDTLSLDSSNLSDINPTGSTEDVGIYLNKTQFKTNDSTQVEVFLVGETFYEQQTKRSKGLLLLSTFPFRDFTEGFLNSVFPNGFVGARVVKLPKLYVAFIGGLLWRENQSADPIVWDGYQTFQTPKNEYLTKMSYYGYSSSTDKVIEPNLINLPKSVKDQFIQEFKGWVNQNIGSTTQQKPFESKILLYSKDVGEIGGKEANQTFLLKQIKAITDFIIFNPKIFNGDVNQGKLIINQGKYGEYIDTFKSTFNSLVKDDNTGNNDTEKEKKSKNENNLLKLEIYNYFKNINNKWVAGSGDGKGFSVCGDNQSAGKNLIDYFKFIDRGWRDIGKDVTINLKSFLNVGNEYNTSIYFFMAKILRDNHFLFQILPTFINYKDANEISEMFKPQTNIDRNKSNGPLFCGIYVGGISEYLDIKERDNYHFNNDGWSFKNGEIPSDILDDKKAKPSEVAKSSEDYSLVAFRVAFGAQNQTIFTDVSLNQQESKETAEYFSVLSDTIDKRGATQPAYIGTNLLRMFKARSYTCSVNALGCMNIQPLMYFDLQNVPFFNGAYLITSVDHQITPNHMVTSFKGIRQSKYQTKPTTDIVTNVDIDLNETDSSAPVIFTNIDNTDGLYTIGLRTDIAGQEFDFDQITQGNLELIGVPTSVIVGLGDLQTNLANPIKKKGLTSNSEVTMFLANVLANSNYLQNSSPNWSEGKYQDNEVKFKPNSPFSGETKKYQNSTIEVVNGGDNKYFSYIPTISGETSTGYTKEYAYSFTGEDEKLKEWDKVEFSGDQLTTPLTNLTYYNIYEGDAFMYRPTGYLYMVGRKQYYDFYSDSGIQPPYEYYKDNSKSLEIALKVWKEIKDPDSSINTSGKTSSEYSITKNDKGTQMLGSYSIFERTRVVSQQYNPKSPELTARIFKRIIETFYDKSDKKPLIDYTNP